MLLLPLQLEDSTVVIRNAEDCTYRIASPGRYSTGRQAATKVVLDLYGHCSAFREYRYES